jgi:hypothetical protein
MSQDINNNSQDNNNINNESTNINLDDIKKAYSELYSNIQRQILQYRGMLKQIDGKNQLTNKKNKNEKKKINKAIARLYSILTNQSAAVKFFNNMEKNQLAFEKAMEQYQQLQQEKNSVDEQLNSSEKNISDQLQNPLDNN